MFTTNLHLWRIRKYLHERLWRPFGPLPSHPFQTFSVPSLHCYSFRGRIIETPNYGHTEYHWSTGYERRHLCVSCDGTAKPFLLHVYGIRTDSEQMTGWQNMWGGSRAHEGKGGWVAGGDAKRGRGVKVGVGGGGNAKRETLVLEVPWEERVERVDRKWCFVVEF